MNPPLGQLLGAWVAAGLTLCIFSFLYEDNPFYRLAERLYVGASLGYLLVQVIFQTLIPLGWEPLVGSPRRWELLIPLLLGLLLLCRLHPRAAWLGRWPLALLMGYGAGMAIPSFVASQVFLQVRGTVQPLVRMTGIAGRDVVDTSATALWADLSALVVLVGVFSVLASFFLTVERRGPLKHVSRMGRLYLMLGFGASYGLAVQGRLALAYDRFADLKEFGMPQYRHASYILAGLLFCALAALRLKRGKPA